ncbi:PREDICTED: SAP30-binding protein-like isoform X2 [Branchiostoma belcheri]|uniref:SAP30-binding protein-like isoform X2 n=1 Tax=Branchiostoma belcheri TaxID=7741 RepID=A0A6P4XY37_BRABE|nr:PREDICTED: SAP30-binding protein-like isoform X2 [Branchiostoma belcheri]KAI8508795.1 SAP30-binding protein [Branchiostoma belcheri]
MESSTAIKSLISYGGSDEEDSDEETEGNVKPAQKAVGLVAYGAGDEDEVKDTSMEEPREEDEDDYLTGRMEEGDIAMVDSDNDSQDSGPKDLLSESVRNMSEDDIVLPPEPPGRCSKQMQEKISRLYDQMRGGRDLNQMIQRRKDFRNPSIYEKLIHFIGIDENGTNYPKDVYNPHMWGEDSHYEALAKAQKEDMARREKEKKDRTKIEFLTGTAKKPVTQTTTGVAGVVKTEPADPMKRKSKWDQSSTQIQTITTTKPTVVTLAAPNTTGKTTVISAVGTIVKKAKVADPPSKTEKKPAEKSQAGSKD